MQLPSIDWVTKFILSVIATIGLFLGGVSAISIYNSQADKRSAQHYMDTLEINLPVGLYLTAYEEELSFSGDGVRYLVYKIQDEKNLAGSDIDPQLFQHQPLTDESKLNIIRHAEDSFTHVKQYTRDSSYANYYKETIDDTPETAQYRYKTKAVILYSKEKQQYVFIIDVDKILEPID